MRLYALLILLLTFKISYAQKGIEKLAMNKIDSLKRINVDTILWYHSYCGECFFERTKAPIKYYNCKVQSGYDLSYNAIIYKQNNKYYILNFDCTNLIIKKQVDGCKSLSYMISIIPTLIARDKTLKEMRKKGKFAGPYQMDGGFEEADIYLKKIKKHISMSDFEETDKAFRKYYWTNKQVKLFKLIAKDIPKNN